MDRSKIKNKSRSGKKHKPTENNDSNNVEVMSVVPELALDRKVAALLSRVVYGF